ncbi:MAG: SufD family Fe-S cluster assembly protein [Nitrososphaerota archaeon]
MKSNEPSWLQDFRKKNWELFASYSFPKSYEWKHVSLSKLSFDDIKPSCNMIMKTNNCLESRDLSMIKNYLILPEDKFEALNNAVFTPKIIFAKSNATVDIFFKRKNFSKIFIFCDDTAKINVKINSSDFSIIQLYLYISGEAKIDIFDNSSENINLITECFVSLNENASLKCDFSLFGTSLNRFKIEAKLLRNAKSEINGVFFGNREQQFAISTILSHLDQKSESNVKVKGVLREKSSSTVYGLVDVSKSAQNVKSRLMNRFLLLDEAKANSIPSLKIDANDVDVKHSVIVQDLDEEQIFYLMSRGLSRAEANTLIVNSFLNDAKINSFKNQKFIEAKMK